MVFPLHRMPFSAPWVLSLPKTSAHNWNTSFPLENGRFPNWISCLPSLNYHLILWPPLMAFSHVLSCIRAVWISVIFPDRLYTHLKQGLWFWFTVILNITCFFKLKKSHLFMYLFYPVTIMFDSLPYYHRNLIFLLEDTFFNFGGYVNFGNSFLLFYKS